MPNYSLILDTKFKPFSYQEMLAPVIAATQAHQAIEEEYGNLATKANVWEEMANEQTDPYAYKMYKTYSEDLESMAEQLARSGLNPASRRNMLSMKSRYSSEILPIEIAYKRREKLADEQRKAITANPTLRYQRMAGQMSLDDFIRNPSLDYGESYSGALLTQQVSQAATNLQRALADKGQLQNLGLPYQYERMLQYGATPSQVLAAMAEQAQNEPETATFLRGIVDQVMQSSGVVDWADPSTLNEFRAFANQGLYSAIGQAKLDNFTDTFSLNDAIGRRREARTAARKVQERFDNLAINPLNIFSSREMSEEEKKYNDDVKKYSKYFYKENGQWKMNQEGWKAYNSKKYTPGTVSPSTNIPVTQGQFVDSDFKRFIDRLGGKGVISSDSLDPNQIVDMGRLWGKYVNESPAARTARYDATRVTEYDYPIASAQQGDMKDAIMTANRGLSLKEVDYDSKSKQFKDTGAEITMEALKNNEYKVTATRFSPYGTTVMIQDDKGNVRRFRMPAGINTTNEQNRDRAMVAASQWQQVVNTGQYTDARGNIHQATPDEITYAQQQYARAIQQAYLFHSQLGVQNKTKEQEYNSYVY